MATSTQCHIIHRSQQRLHTRKTREHYIWGRHRQTKSNRGLERQTEIVFVLDLCAEWNQKLFRENNKTLFCCRKWKELALMHCLQELTEELRSTSRAEKTKKEKMLSMERRWWVKRVLGGFWRASGLLFQGLKCHPVVLFKAEASSSESRAVRTLRLDHRLSCWAQTSLLLPAEMTDGRKTGS